MTTLIQYVRKIARQPHLDTATDLELLLRFASSRDEAAFSQLVHRHGSMVFGVCRRMLGDTPDAEDSFQATFLVLARKAGSIRRRELLANWLYGVARRAAAKARARSLKRRVREQPMNGLSEGWLESSAPGAPDPVEMIELRRVLDEEVSRLPKRYRLPFVLCYLEGVTNESAARQLRCPKGTVQSRLAWARQRLRNRLIRRGFALPAALVGVDLLAESAGARVPPALATATIQAASCFVAGPALGGAAGAVSASVASLTQGVLHTMFMIKVKSTAAAVLMVLLAGVAAWGMARPNLIPQPAEKLPEVSLPSPDGGDKPGKDQDKPSKEKKADSKFEAKEVVSKSFPTGSKPTLKLEVFNGPINVVAAEESGVSVRLTKESRASSDEKAKEGLSHIQVNMSQDGDSIIVRATRAPETKRDEHLSASAELRVARGTVLVLHTSNGPVIMKGGKSSSWNAATSNGPITVSDHQGDLHLKTSNGPIRVSRGMGPLDLKTSNGRIEMEALDAIVDAHTSNGRVSFKGKFQPGKQNFHSSNGNIALDIPPDTEFKIDASTSHGRISTGFKLESSGKKGKTHLQGKVGSEPSVSLQIHTSNGNIAVNPASASRSKSADDAGREKD